jgi:hypothetical protein
MGKSKWSRAVVPPLLAAVSALGCDCIAPPLCQRVFNTDVIFIGKVVDDGVDIPGARPTRDTEFAIQEVLKGLPGGSKTVAVNPSRDTDCWFPLEKGRRYLIFAWRGQGELRTALCSGSDEFERAGRDLVDIRKLAKVPRPPASPRRNIEATVKWWDGAPVEGAFVICKTEPDDPCVANETSVAVTDARGIATCEMPSDLSSFAVVSELRGQPYKPPRFAFGAEVFQEIFLDDLAIVEVPPSPNTARVELVLTHENQTARTAVDKTRERQ